MADKQSSGQETNARKEKSESHITKEGGTKIPYLWLLRPCEVYKEEYKDCTRIRSRMYQLYIDGETQDCSQWKKDYENCLQYRKRNDMEALSEVLEVEKQRYIQRIQTSRANDVWEYRDSPPPG